MKIYTVVGKSFFSSKTWAWRLQVVTLSTKISHKVSLSSGFGFWSFASITVTRLSTTVSIYSWELQQFSVNLFLLQLDPKTSLYDWSVFSPTCPNLLKRVRVQSVIFNVPFREHHRSPILIFPFGGMKSNDFEDVFNCLMDI